MLDNNTTNKLDSPSNNTFFVDNNFDSKNTGRPKDEVWEHFTEVTYPQERHKGAICNFCSNKWKRGRPQILRSHLAIHCKAKVPRDIRIEYLRVIADYNQNTEIVSTSTNAYMNKRHKLEKGQKQIHTYYDTDRIDDAKIKYANQALIQWFVYSGIPFIAADSPFFMDFTKSLCYGYNPPRRTTLSNSLLDSEIAKITLKLDSILRNATNLTLCMYILKYLFNNYFKY